MLDLGDISGKNHPHHHQVNLSDHSSGRVSDSYGSYGTRARRTAQNYSNFRTWSGPVLAEGKMVEEVDDSGFCSPPLWRTSPTGSPPHRNNHYRSLSPVSKAQAIARGQRELMEMVSRMPESCYELSLKDLVEQQPMMEVKQESFREEKGIRNEDMYKREKGIRNEDMYKREKGMKRNEKMMEIRKSNGSWSKNNEGFLLKMVFPIGFGRRTKMKKSDSLPNNFYSKISPKSPTPEESEKAVDKEWWKNKFSVESTETESCGSSSNNGSGKSSVSSNSSSIISRSGSSNESGGCWSFIRTQKRKDA